MHRCKLHEADQNVPRRSVNQGISPECDWQRTIRGGKCVWHGNVASRTPSSGSYTVLCLGCQISLVINPSLSSLSGLGNLVSRSALKPALSHVETRNALGTAPRVSRTLPTPLRLSNLTRHGSAANEGE